MPNIRTLFTAIINTSQKARTAIFAALDANKQLQFVAADQHLIDALEALESSQTLAKDQLFNANAPEDAWMQLYIQEHIASSHNSYILVQEIIALQRGQKSKSLHIMLICASGMSSGMLMKKMNEWAANNKQKIHVKAFGIGEYHKHIEEYDIVLLGPQMHHRLNDIAASIDKPVHAIPPLDFAVGNVENIMQMIRTII